MTFNNKHEAEQAVRADRSLKLVPILGGKYLEWDAVPAAEAEKILAKVRKTIGTLNIELRKVQFAAFASEETNCYTAEVYVNGKRLGHCHNEGHGGPTSVEPRNLNEHLDAYGATLPLTVSTIPDKDDPTGFFTYQPDAENICDDLFEKWQEAKEAERQVKKLQRDLQTKVIFTVKGKKGIYTTKKLEAARLKEVIEKRLVRDADIILNTLPFAEAKRIYDANVEVVYR